MIFDDITNKHSFIHSFILSTNFGLGSLQNFKLYFHLWFTSSKQHRHQFIIITVNNGGILTSAALIENDKHIQIIHVKLQKKNICIANKYIFK
jgi:hypothetical protein